MIYDIHPGDDLFDRMHHVAAGDEVVVHAGTYTTPGLVMVTWPGTAAQPINIHAAPGEHVVIQGNPSQNVLDVGGSYFTFKGFEITGGSHGVRLAATDHATLEDLVIHDIGDVGISCNRDSAPCAFVTIRHNEIYATGMAGTGEGMYLGGNDATNIFHDCLIERNYVHDTGGDQGDGIEIKTGAYANTVRDNVIVRTKYPAITMYGFTGAGMPNIVERNYINGTQDNGIQIVGQIYVRNNIIMGAAASGIASKASQNQTPHDLAIINNTVIGPGITCIKANDWATPANQVVANNAVYCEGGKAIELTGGAPSATLGGNVGLGTANPTGGFSAGASVTADLGSATQPYPPAGSLLVDTGDTSHAAADDFNGTPRDQRPDVGAYERTGVTNPGWTLQDGFKTETPVTGGELPVLSDDVIPGDDEPGGKGSGCCNTGGAGASPLLAGLVALLLRSSARRRRRQA